MKTRAAATVAVSFAAIFNVAAAIVSVDNFGSGADAFSIDFVTIGNPNNADDAGDGGGTHSSPYGGVSYTFRMSVTEVPQDWIAKATNLGLTNVTTGYYYFVGGPAADVMWYEAAAFVNFLNTSTGHQRAYDLTFSGGNWSVALWSSAEAWQVAGENLYRHKEAYYFLPNEDEWYKAAYHKNDGATANYWDFATGSNSAPTPVRSGTGVGTAVYNYPSITPAARVDNNGGLSAYGTRGQNGNVYEYLESAFDGSNDAPAESRSIRGGAFQGTVSELAASNRIGIPPTNSGSAVGFRVASIPEPSIAMLLIGSALMLSPRRRRAGV